MEGLDRVYSQLRKILRQHGPLLPIFSSAPDEPHQRRQLGAQVRAIDALAGECGMSDRVEGFDWRTLVGMMLDIEGPRSLLALGYDLQRLADFEAALRSGGDAALLVKARGAWRCGTIMSWARGGFHAVRLTGEQAAAFAWSAEDLDPAEVRAPWPALAIDIPAGVIPWKSAGEPGRRGIDTSLTRLLVRDIVDEDDDDRYVTLHATAADGDTTFFGPPVRASMLIKTWIAGCVGMNDTPGDRRVWECLSRIAFSTMISMSDPARVRPARVKKPAKGQKWKTSALQGLDYVDLDQPVTVDARDVVADYIGTGLAGHIGVRVLVRGHHKSQPHGPRSGLRKVIWVDCFWRGPDGAPVAVHPHVLTGAAAGLGEVSP